MMGRGLVEKWCLASNAYFENKRKISDEESLRCSSGICQRSTCRISTDPCSSGSCPNTKSAHGAISVTGVFHGINTATQVALTRLIKPLECKESAGDTYAATEFRALQSKAALES